MCVFWFFFQAFALIVLLGIAFAEPWGRGGGWGGGRGGGWGGGRGRGGGWGGGRGWGRKRRSVETEILDDGDMSLGEEAFDDIGNVLNLSNRLSKRSAVAWGGWGGGGWGGRGGHGHGWGK